MPLYQNHSHPLVQNAIKAQRVLNSALVQVYRDGRMNKHQKERAVIALVHAMDHISRQIKNTPDCWEELPRVSSA